MTRTVIGATLLLAVSRASAQRWQAGGELDLIRRAVVHRTARDADTLLSAWQAKAHGILRYATVTDHGDGPVERVIRADELQVEVYGESPNRSKQTIVAWRDTSFLPNRMNYHRDHLGIVANDFGPTIRLGQGDEVRDVPHPLSEAGLARYQFALGDTIVLVGPGGRVRVTAIQVRPVHPDSMGAVGTLYLDIERAALVRFRFTFTPASYRDRTVQDITVTLENGLQQNVRWLPWQQSIVIRRGVALLDLPLQSVIRADWTIDDYELGVRQPVDRFAGSPIGGLRAPVSGGSWTGPIAGNLSELPATDADVADVERDASRALGGRLLDGLPRLRFAGSGVSDFIHANRVDGVTLSIGGRAAIAARMIASGRFGVGLSDHRVLGAVGLSGPLRSMRWSITGERLMRDVSDEPVISGVANTIGTIISGADQGDYALVERVAGSLTGTVGATRITLAAGMERSRSVAPTFRPISGQVSANPALGIGAATVIRATAATSDRHGRGWTIDGEVGNGDSRWGRLRFAARTRIALPSGELQLRGETGLATDRVPGYRELVLGGRGTLLGVPFRSLGGRRIARAELAWALPVAIPTPPFPYARYTHLRTTIAPYIAAGIAGGEQTWSPWRATNRVEPVAGLRLDLWGPVLRIDSGISLRTGRAAVTIDVHPDWWPLM